MAVLDISATTISEDESNVENIPSAESKGLVVKWAEMFLNTALFGEFFLIFSFTGFNFDTEDSDRVIPGFVDAIVGIKAGETKSFPLFFPESWRQENLRGVHAQFTVRKIYVYLFPAMQRI